MAIDIDDEDNNEEQIKANEAMVKSMLKLIEVQNHFGTNLNANAKKLAEMFDKLTAEGVDTAAVQHKMVSNATKDFNALKKSIKEAGKVHDEFLEAAEGLQTAMDRTSNVEDRAALAAMKREALVASAWNNTSKAMEDASSRMSKSAVSGLGGFVRSLQDSSTSSTQLSAGLMNSAVDMAGAGVAGIAAAGAGIGAALMAIPTPWTIAGGAVVSALSLIAGGIGEAGTKLAKFGIDIASKEVEKQSKSFTEMSNSGALFSNGMTGMRDAARGSGLAVDQFSNVVKNNSVALAQSGVGITEGAKQIGRVGSIIKQSGVQAQLQNLGYGFEEQAALTAETIASMRKNAGGTVNDADVAENTKKYAENLRLIAETTGADAKTQIAKRAAENEELAFKQVMAKQSPAQIAQVDKAMSVMTDIEAKNLRERMVFGKVISQEGAIYEANVKGAREKGEAHAQLLRDGNLNVQTANEQTVKFGETIRASVLENQSMAKAGMAGNADIQAVNKDMSDALNQATNITKDSNDANNKNLKDAEKPTDELTDSLMGADRAAQDARLALQDILTPAIGMFAETSVAMLETMQDAMEEIKGITHTKPEREEAEVHKAQIQKAKEEDKDKSIWNKQALLIDKLFGSREAKLTPEETEKIHSKYKSPAEKEKEKTNKPVKAEPVKAEPTPVKAEPTPVKAEPTPVKAEPTPVKAEPSAIPKIPDVGASALTDRILQNASMAKAGSTGNSDLQAVNKDMDAALNASTAIPKLTDLTDRILQNASMAKAGSTGNSDIQAVNKDMDAALNALTAIPKLTDTESLKHIKTQTQVNQVNTKQLKQSTDSGIKTHKTIKTTNEAIQDLGLVLSENITPTVLNFGRVLNDVIDSLTKKIGDLDLQSLDDIEVDKNVPGVNLGALELEIKKKEKRVRQLQDQSGTSLLSKLLGGDSPELKQAKQEAELAKTRYNQAQMLTDQYNEGLQDELDKEKERIADEQGIDVNDVELSASETEHVKAGYTEKVAKGHGAELGEARSATQAAEKPTIPLKASGTFKEQAPALMKNLMKDFDLTKEQAAGITGNLGHESAGLKAGIQEGGVKQGQGRGGLGWAQWTGPRRKAFESYLAESGQKATDPAANYGFLKRELTTTHKGALAAVKKETTGSGAMMAFEDKFEAAKVKHYEGRQKYTDQAMAMNLEGGPEAVASNDAPKVEQVAKAEPKVEQVAKAEPKVEQVAKAEPKVEGIAPTQNSTELLAQTDQNLQTEEPPVGPSRPLSEASVTAPTGQQVSSFATSIPAPPLALVSSSTAAEEKDDSTLHPGSSGKKDDKAGGGSDPESDPIYNLLSSINKNMSASVQAQQQIAKNTA